MIREEDSQLLKSSQPEILRGQWIVTRGATGDPGMPLGIIDDGALVIAGGMIQAVGKYREIKKDFGQFQTREHGGRVIAPALINGHCHLELSHLEIAGRTRNERGYDGDPTVWISDLLTERERFSRSEDDVETLILNDARNVLKQMSEEGVAFVADIGNSLTSRKIGDKQGTRVNFLLELLGLTKESETKSSAILSKIIEDKSLNIGCTAHAPYSTTPFLLKAIKKQADRQGQIFSIHVAESSHEVEFLRTGAGPFKEFLHGRGAWDGSFRVPAMGAVQYLESLGVLNSKTLCVHGAHVNQAEIGILARHNAKVCLCPGSNRFLGVGKAPVTEFLAHGILPALGTDSKASNPILSMWREMRILRQDHPGLKPETVFAMATLGGAEAWGVASEMGALEPGKRAMVLAIDGEKNVHSTREIFEYLTTAGESVETEWLAG